MKLLDFPPELALKIIEAAELTPTQLLTLGHQLTRAPNVISEAALDDSMWKTWSSAESLRCADSTSLSEAFVQRWSQKTPAMRQELVRLYQHGLGPLNPRLPEDVDLTLAACAAGLGRDVLGFVSNAMLQEPAVAARLLVDRTIFSETLPHTFLTLQSACARFEFPVPKWSMSNALWKKFSPQSALDQGAITPLYVSAVNRFRDKPECVKKTIVSATETQRRKLLDFILPTPADFDLNLALHHNEKHLIVSPDPVLGRVLIAIQCRLEGYVSPRASTQPSMGSEVQFGDLLMTEETQREALELAADPEAFHRRLQASLSEA